MRISNFDKNANDDICNHHYHKYGLVYSCLQKYCCDPFAKHKKRIDNNLSILELETCKTFNYFNEIKLMPGKKICYNCTTKIKKHIEKNKLYDCCCDPYKRHRLPIKHNLILIDKCTSDKLTSLFNMTICGYKVCQFCFSTIHNSETNSENARYVGLD